MKTRALVAIVTSMMVSCMAAELPSPILVLKGTEDYVVRGSAFTRYNLSISNQTAFPDDLFAPAPDLPPAGTNINAARTWVSIYETSGRYIYGFAALRSAASLDRLWFAVSKGTEPPDKVYVVLHDRRQNVKLTSNQVRTKAGNTAEEPAPPKTSGTVANEGGDVKLAFMPSGAMPKIGYYMPQRLTLTRERPVTLRRPPANLVAPLYGVLKFGPRSSPTSFLVVLDEPDDKPARLFVDSNANGDLADDPPAEWSTRTVSSRDGEARKHYSGGANVTARYGSLSLTMHLSMYRFDKNDPSRARLKDIVYYYRDYAYTGDIVLGGKSYRAMLCDEMAAGDFRGNTERQSSGVRLLIDVNDNGKFDRRGESFDVRQPFNIGGTTYEIAGMTAMGDRFQIIKSAQTVAEVPTPPDLSTGKKAVVFSAATTSREKVRFPADYKGKIVLLDFWATWCGPCVAELPKLTAVYEKHHSRGLEVLGISLDNENTQGRLTDFTKQNNMPWPQICDGKSWKAEIAQLYAVDSIPRAYLVDGDTGEILAGEGRLRGDALARTIEDELAKKSGAPPATPAPQQDVKRDGTSAPVPTVKTAEPETDVGNHAAAFVAKTTDGKEVRFPADYIGSIVLLDFWATWCGPCVSELPNLVAVYEKYHSQGLEVLGISLDNENSPARLADFTKQKNMRWPQVCDGKGWKGGIAQLYAVDSIPRAYLVDGDSGEILAAGRQLRGAALAATIQQVLTKRSR